MGINKILAKIWERPYWVKCRIGMESMCKKCNKCAAISGPGKKTREKVYLYNVCARFERTGTEVADPFLKSDRYNKYILVKICQFLMAYCKFFYETPRILFGNATTLRLSF